MIGELDHYIECDCGRQTDVIRSNKRLTYWCSECNEVIAEEDDQRFA